MGLNQNHALGRNQKFIIQPDQTSDTYPAFRMPNNLETRAPAALTVKSSSMNYEQERKNRSDASQSRDYSERISGNKTVSWGCECHILIPDQTSAAVNPDWHYLMGSAMSASASSGSGPYTITYSLTHAQADAIPMTLIREMNSVMSEAVWGAVVEDMTISIAQGDEPSIAFSGTASDYAATATTTVSDGTPTGSATITVADGGALSVNSVIKIGSDDGSGNTGFQVESISGNDITLNETVTAASNGDAIIPFLDPDITSTASTLINGISGQLDWGSDTDLEINSFSLTVKNNYKGVQEAFKAATQDYVAGRRDITGEMVVTGAKDKIAMLIKRYNFNSSSNIVARFGGTATGEEKLTITIAKPEFDFAEVTVPEAEEVTISLPFTALATTGTATDAVSIAITTN